MDDNHVLKEFVAGGISGISGLIAGHPFDTIKTIMQNSNNRSFIDVANKIRWAQTNRAYFRGVSIPVMFNFTLNGITFGSFKKVQSWLDPREDDLGAIAVAGCAAGGVQLIAAVPSELIKIKMQITAVKHESKNQTTIKCIREIVSKDGIVKGLYRGTLITAARDIPSFGIYFTTYHVLRDQFYDNFKLKYFASSFLAGGMAGMACWICTFPADIIKTRIQSGKNKNTIDCIKFLRPYGYRIYFTGLSVVCLRAALVNAVIFVVYDTTINFLNGPTWS